MYISVCSRMQPRPNAMIKVSYSPLIQPVFLVHTLNSQREIPTVVNTLCADPIGQQAQHLSANPNFAC